MIIGYSNESTFDNAVREAKQRGARVHIEWVVVSQEDEPERLLGIAHAESPEFVQQYRQSGGLWAYED